MPPYSDKQVSALKRELRAAASTGYRFTDDVAAALQAEVELSPEQIRKWVLYVHGRYTTDDKKEKFINQVKV